MSSKCRWRAREREDYEKRVVARLDARRLIRAQFITSAAIANCVRVAVVGDPRSPCVFVWAPTAPTVERQLACERSFKRAVLGNLDSIALLADQLSNGGRPQ